MPKPGKNKKSCELYKQRGRLEINKKAKAERNQKRIERFEKRKEEGKTYEYKPNPFDRKSKNKGEVRRYWKERRKRASKNVDRRTPFQKLTSLLRKTQNALDKEERIRKLSKDKSA